MIACLSRLPTLPLVRRDPGALWGATGAPTLTVPSVLGAETVKTAGHTAKAFDLRPEPMYRSALNRSQGGCHEHSNP